MEGDIIRYKIRLIDPSPMYGRDEDISGMYVDREKAICDAKQYAKRMLSNRVYVGKYIYTSQRNYERNRQLTMIYEWSVWLDGLDDEVK